MSTSSTQLVPSHPGPGRRPFTSDSGPHQDRGHFTLEGLRSKGTPEGLGAFGNKVGLSLLWSLLSLCLYLSVSLSVSLPSRELAWP